MISSEDSIGSLLKEKGLTLAVAESCTGGLLSKMITDVSGASEYFDRGYVTYSNSSKCEELGVGSKLLEKYGAVSSETAISMAEGAARKSGADIAVAVTGVAGPDGGTKEKPVGTVFIAVAGPSGTVEKKFLFSGERWAVREAAASEALRMLEEYLKSF